MQREITIRICGTCDNPLKFRSNGTQEGMYCCEEYYHEGACLAASFDDNSMTWEQHYNDQGGDDGECCYTEWELELVEVTA